MKYFVLNQSNTIVNVIIWDGVSEYHPGEGLRLEDASNHPTGVWIGWQYLDGTWQAPPDPTPS